VDFGNIEIKSIKDFFPLYKSFTDLPAQAIACSLSEVCRKLWGFFFRKIKLDCFCKAFPRHQNENEPMWSDETIEIFKEEVIDKVVEIHFINEEEGTQQW
jgi:hypothetical protein